jgi:hypothetical protein
MLDEAYYAMYIVTMKHERMTYGATDPTRTFGDLPGGRDIDSAIVQRMAAEFGVEGWHVGLERVRLAMPARSSFSTGGSHGLHHA